VQGRKLVVERSEIDRAKFSNAGAPLKALSTES
jgi:hypothetical protein